MRIREWVRYPAMRVALAAFAAAIATAAWSFVRAVRIDGVPDLPPPTLASAGSITQIASGPPTDIQAAVEKDPFAPDRSAPASPYRLPGEANPNDATPAAEPPKPVVLGTVVSSDGPSFAVIQLGDARSASVRVGDRVGGYTVKSIERGRVVFTTPAGKRLDVNALQREP